MNNDQTFLTTKSGAKIDAIFYRISIIFKQKNTNLILGIT